MIQENKSIQDNTQSLQMAVMVSAGLNVVSYFDGMSSGQIALKKEKLNYKNYHAFEIKPHAIKVTQENFPETKQMGSVVDADLSELPKTDLFIGGSPCQSFSIAGDGSGFDGKSGLFWEYVKAKEVLKPKYFLLENVVPKKKEWQDVISKALGVEPVFINSKLFSAQNRPRLYWTNIPFNKEMVDRKKYLKDVLNINTKKPLKDGIDRVKIIEKVTVRKYTVDIVGLQKLLKESKDRTINDIAKALNQKKTTVEHWFRTDKCFSIPDANIWLDLKNLLNIRNNNFDDSIMVFEEKDNIFDMANRVYRINGKSPTLTASGKKIKCIDDDGNVHLLNAEHFKKLQTIPSDYKTDSLTDSQLMNLTGDGWTIDVIAYILSFIPKIAYENES